MTNTELVAHVRRKLAAADKYPWHIGLQERDIIALCDSLEAKDKELLAAAERIASQSEHLSRRAEKYVPLWWPEVKRKCGILLSEALKEATCYFSAPLLILQLTFPVTRLGVREYCRDREPLLRAIIAEESKQNWSIRFA